VREGRAEYGARWAKKNVGSGGRCYQVRRSPARIARRTRGLWVPGYGFDRWCLGMGTAILKKTCFLFLERESIYFIFLMHQGCMFSL
jgi:hypothetical protein